MRTMKLSCEQIHFLGVCTQIPTEGFISEPVKLWEKYMNDGTMDRLLSITGANKVFGVSGLNCDAEHDKYYYYIVCENRNNAVSDEFEAVEIEPSHYMAFEEKGTDPLGRVGVYTALYEEAYKEWLPDSKYEALVDPYVHTFTKGYAIVESIMPKELESANYEIEMWLPVKRPAGYEYHNNKRLSETIKNFKK